MVVEEDGLVLLGRFRNECGIAKVHGGEATVDHDERFAFAAHVIGELDVADLGVFQFGFELGVQWRVESRSEGGDEGE